MNKHFYVIEQDLDPPNPRKEYDNLGTMYHHPREYGKGDVPIPDNDETKLKANLVGWGEEELERLWTFWENKLGSGSAHPFGSQQEQAFLRRVREKVDSRIEEEFNKRFIWIDYPFGFIAVSIEKVKDEYRWKHLTKERIARIEGYLKGEVETFTQYLEGEVYGYQIFSITPEFEARYAEDLAEVPLQEFIDEIQDEDWLKEEEKEGRIEQEDSCWGFYGEEYCRQEAREMVKFNDGHWQEYQDKLTGQQSLPLTAQCNTNQEETP